MSRAGFVILVAAVWLSAPASAAAEWQIRPSLGFSFGGNTTVIDLDHAVGNSHLVYGLSATAIGEIFGVEADFGYLRNPFTTDAGLITSSSTTTLTGNVVIALPRHMTRYTLRPYIVGGGGLMHMSVVDPYNVFTATSNRPAFDVGGGVTGFLNDHVGLNWDLRWFNTLGSGETSNTVGPSGQAEEFSFWRGNMGVALRW